jgi:TRAP-type C4-dicarboxylate transport system permease small subunit
MNTVLKTLRFLDRATLAALKSITIIIFLLLTILISANVFVRFVPVASMHWFDEIIEMLYAYLVFYGAAALWINKEHLKIGDWISGKLIRGKTRQRIYKIFLEVIGLVFVLIFTYYSARLTTLAMDVTNVFAIPKKILYSCMPASGAIMVIYSIRNCVVQFIGILKPEPGGA